MSKRTLGWCSLGVALLFSVLVYVSGQEGSIQEVTKLNQETVQLYGQGRYGEAIPLAQRALGIREKALGPEHPDTATSLNNLAAAVSRHGRLSPRRSRYTSGRWRFARKRSAPSIRTPPPRSTISPCCITPRAPTPRRSRYTSARWRLARKPSAPSIRTPPPRSTISPCCITPRVTTPRRSRCTSARWRFARKPSAPSIRTPPNPQQSRRAVSGPRAPTPRRSRCTSARWRIREKALGPEHPDTATSLNNLAMLYYATGALRQGGAAVPAGAGD